MVVVVAAAVAVAVVLEVAVVVAKGTDGMVNGHGSRRLRGSAQEEAHAVMRSYPCG